MASVAGLANRANVLKRHRGAQSTEYTEAKREHAAAAIAEAAERYLAQVPRLTDEQIERIADILRGAKDAER